MNDIGSLDHLPNELITEVLDFSHRGSFNYFHHLYSLVPSFQAFLQLKSNDIVIITNSQGLFLKDEKFHMIEKDKALVVDLNKDTNFYSLDQYEHCSFIFVIYQNEILEGETSPEDSPTETFTFKARDHDIITPKPHWEKSLSFFISELHYLKLKYEAVLIGDEFDFNNDLISKNLCSKMIRRLCDGIRYIQTNKDVTVFCDSWGKSKQVDNTRIRLLS